MLVAHLYYEHRIGLVSVYQTVVSTYNLYVLLQVLLSLDWECPSVLTLRKKCLCLSSALVLVCWYFVSLDVVLGIILID